MDVQFDIALAKVDDLARNGITQLASVLLAEGTAAQISRLLGVFLICLVLLRVAVVAGWRVLSKGFEWVSPVPVLNVQLTPEELDTSGGGEPDWVAGTPYPEDRIPCYDPATMRMHCPAYLPAMSAEEVQAAIAKASVAQQKWKTSSWEQRRMFVRIVRRFIIDHSEEICRVSARDSGKPLVDAAFGEVIVTLEKCSWLIARGEEVLKPDYRKAGQMMFYKSARVEYHPVGVAAAIVPWNYPFHNVFNPLLAHVFAGNGLVIKVSEHASWSSLYYGRIISAALAAAGAPSDLVQIVTGYAECGGALVGGEVGHVTFVGSTSVGKRVMAAASQNLTPVTLELGGKDAVIVLEDAKVRDVVPTALRGAFQSCGQNCAGAERFIVHQKVYDEFVQHVTKISKGLRQGPPLSGAHGGLGDIDCGAMCMPGEVQRIHALVEDAKACGARVLVGGVVSEEKGQFYPPTVIADATLEMRLATEEVFGPVFVIFKATSDDDAVRIANACPFGLGSNVFGSTSRARAVGKRLEAGMTSINDFCSTYMSQDLPFGGVKDSGFGRFAGVEGLRGICVPKAVSEDIAPWLLNTTIPGPLQYPVKPAAFPLVQGLCRLFFGTGPGDFTRALANIASAFVFPPRSQTKAA